MSNRAAKIAGAMLAKRDANGNARTPAKAVDVAAALYAADVHPAVVREWENEAFKRHGLPSRSELAGRDYRDIQAFRAAARQQARDLRLDKRYGYHEAHDAKYKPGLFRRAMTAAIERLAFVAKRRAQRRARKISRRA